MKKLILLLSFCSFTLLSQAQTIIHPVIKNYGGLAEIPFPVEKLDSTKQYKIVVELGEKLDDNTKVHEALDWVSRMYNAHIYGGVPQKNLHIAVVLYSKATLIALTNDAFKTRLSVNKNANIAAIKEMKEAGIDFYACGQSVQFAKIDPETIIPEVKIEISRFTAISTLGMNGYVHFKY